MEGRGAGRGIQITDIQDLTNAKTSHQFGGLGGRALNGALYRKAMNTAQARSYWVNAPPTRAWHMLLPFVKGHF
jgi:hypothetical protein